MGRIDLALGLIAVAWILTAAFLLLRSNLPIWLLDQNEVGHLVLFFVVTLATSIALYRRPVRWWRHPVVISIVIAIGALVVEGAQRFNPDRHVELDDVVYGWTGVALGLWLTWLALRGPQRLVRIALGIGAGAALVGVWAGALASWPDDEVVYLGDRVFAECAADGPEQVPVSELRVAFGPPTDNCVATDAGWFTSNGDDLEYVEGSDGGLVVRGNGVVSPALPALFDAARAAGELTIGVRVYTDRRNPDLAAGGLIDLLSGPDASHLVVRSGLRGSRVSAWMGLGATGNEEAGLFASGVVDENRWYEVVIVGSTAATRLYVDGEELAMVRTPLGIPDVLDDALWVSVGGRLDATGAISARFSHVVAVPRAIDDSEVQGLFDF